MRRILFIVLGFLLIPGLLLAEGWAFDARILRSYYFPTVNVAPVDSYGTALSVASASPPALWVHPVSTEPFFIEPGANASLVGQYGIYGAGAITNLVQRSSFESWDDANTPTGWTETETAGNGSAAVSEETTTVAHGGSSVKMVLTGTTSEAMLTSDCITVGMGADLYLSTWIKKASGTTVTFVRISEYDTGACGTWLQTDVIVNGVDTTTDWVKYGGLLAAATWHANTSSYKIVLLERCDGGCTLYWDGIQARAASTPTDAYAGCDTDASCVTNLQDITDDNPPEGMQAGGWTFEATVRSPIDGAVGGTPERRIFDVPGTAGNNNKIVLTWSSDFLVCKVWDSAGNLKISSVAAAGNADTNYTAKCSKSNVGVVTACWDGACDATPATDALTDGVGTEIVFGSNGATGGEVWVYNPKLSRGAR